MFKYLKDKLAKIPRHIWILLAIIMIGIFLRTYNFHDWLRFSMDQSRDAQIISDVVEGKINFPLLGPLAGGTYFHLGPVYYYFSIISAKLFGNYPDKIAYPSLFFAILTIPLLFLFLKEYFSKNTSLFLTAIISFSYFFIEDSRFSSNPHLIPFFVLLILYAFLKLINGSSVKKWIWISVLGISFGIAVQLHTTLLVLTPVFIFLIFIIYDHWGLLNFKQLLLVFIIALFLNIPQFISEYNTRGQNKENFFAAIVSNEDSDSSFLKKSREAFICQAKANVNMISSFPAENECSKSIDLDIKKGAKELFGEIKDKSLRKGVYIASIIIIFVFFVFGYSLMFYNLIKEKSKDRKNFLILVFVYNFCALLFLIPIISSISISYFNILFFIPFVFIGMIQEFLSKRGKLVGKIISLLIFIGIFSSIIFFNTKNYFYFKNGLDNNLENSNLGWAENVGKFIVKNSNEKEVIYLSGERKYLNRFEGPLNHMVSRENIRMVEIDASNIDDMIPNGENFFYIKNFNDEKIKGFIGDYEVINGKHFSPVDIYILKNN
ncbi:MAG: glycosyltransferase family 39 protein [Candidatus Moraniibacteriota bacterium]